MNDLQSVSFRLYEADLEAYVKFMTAKQSAASRVIPQMAGRLLIGIFIMLVIGALLNPQYLLIGLSQPEVLLNIGLQYFVALPVFFYLVRWQHQQIFAKQVSGADKKALAGQNITATIDARGFLWRDEGLALEIAWSRVVSVTGDSAYIYIFTNEFSGLIIPRRAFDKPESAQRFGASVLQFWRQGHKAPPIPRP